jgi:hypothetical protein
MSDTIPKGWKWVKLGKIAKYHCWTNKQDRLNKLYFENLARLELEGEV